MAHLPDLASSLNYLSHHKWSHFTESINEWFLWRNLSTPTMLPVFLTLFAASQNTKTPQLQFAGLPANFAYPYSLQNQPNEVFQRTFMMSEGGQDAASDGQEGFLGEKLDIILSKFKQEKKPIQEITRRYVESVIKGNDVAVFCDAQAMQSKSVSNLLEKSQVTYFRVDTSDPQETDQESESVEANQSYQIEFEGQIIDKEELSEVVKEMAGGKGGASIFVKGDYFGNWFDLLQKSVTLEFWELLD